ncbi:MAG: hypothetical protein JWP74_599 [Marmoricola sp.]|nr:hypothetical protein [Marmoricola sp.]
MTRGRHSLASRNRRALKLSLVTAPLVTCAVVGAGITLTSHGSRTIDFGHQVAADIATGQGRAAAISRSAVRTALPDVPAVDGRLWTTADLDLRVRPADGAATHGELPSLSHVRVTGVRRNGFVQVVVGKKAFWVTDQYLAKAKPTDPADLPLVDTPCVGTSGVESGLKPGAIRVYRAVCNNFPQITSYGGYAPRGEHASGKAIDIMTSDVALGTEIADFLKAHAAELDLFDIIWRQHIWTPVRASEGWRLMPSRGSETANHEDHVHVSTN